MANSIISSDTVSSLTNPLNDINQPLVRISVSNCENDFNELRNGRTSNCLRCGYSMDRSKAIFLIVQSPFKEHPSKIRISVNEGAPCTECILPGDAFRPHKLENGSGGRDSESLNRYSPISDKDSAVKEADFQICENNDSTPFPPCTDCHLTLLCDEKLKEISPLDTITLMLEIPSSSKEDQMDRKLISPKSEAGEAMFSEYLLQNEEPSVSGSGRYANIPDMNAETEAAYRSHLKNLVPCSYCKRTFNPDRIMVHENVCVERAKKRVTKVH